MTKGALLMTPEPVASNAVMAAGALTALPMALFGVRADALGLGLFAALLISFWLPTVSTRVRAFAAVTLSGVAAGYLAPLAAGWLASAISAMPGSWAPDEHALRLPVALLLGIVGPTLIPALMSLLKSRVESGGL
jgi:hypothetical protein